MLTTILVVSLIAAMAAGIAAFAWFDVLRTGLLNRRQRHSESTLSSGIGNAPNIGDEPASLGCWWRNPTAYCGFDEVQHHPPHMRVPHEVQREGWIVRWGTAALVVLTVALLVIEMNRPDAIAANDRTKFEHETTSTPVRVIAVGTRGSGRRIRLPNDVVLPLGSADGPLVLPSTWRGCGISEIDDAGSHIRDYVIPVSGDLLIGAP